MSRIDKLILKFKSNPSNIKYKDLDRILKYIGFESIYAKGSHCKYKHAKFKEDIIIPIHNNDCKEFYKKQTYKIIKKIL